LISGEERLRRAVGRFRAAHQAKRGGEVDQRPGCVYGLLTREDVDDLRDSLGDVKDEIKWLRRWLMATFLAVVAEAVLSQLGLM
jgi:hypothetical protein